MKIIKIKKLLNTYGDISLQELLWKVQGNYIYEYPKCEGEGQIMHTYNKYPPGLPDSGFVYEKGIKYVDCELCNSRGFTNRQYKPKYKTELVGYE